MMNSRSRRYVLFTPARDEEENLPSLISDVASQSLKPDLWLILDDHSDDSTPEIIGNAEKEHDFIIGGSVGLERSEYDYGRPNFVKMEGTERLTEAVDGWDYLGILDADSRIELDFYSKMMSHFENDSSLGVASGTYYESGKKIVQDYPRGSLFFRKDCFEDIGGYSNHNDSVFEAVKMGWKAETLSPKIVHTRKTNERKPDFTKGIHLYRCGNSTLHAFMISGLHFMNGKVGRAVGIFSSFLKARFEGVGKYDHINPENFRKNPKELFSKVVNRARAA